MKRYICQFIFQSLVFNSFSYFNTLHAVAQDPSCEKQETTDLTRNMQPINIVNLSIATSAAELKQLLSTLQQLDTKQTSTYQASKETLQQVGNSLNDLANKYKYWLPVTAATCIYCSLFYKIAHANKLLNSTGAWCNWKSELNLSALLSLSQKDLAIELITDIQKKYSDPQNPTNFVTPMVNFINEINHEIQELENYVKIVNLIKTIKLKSIYPIISDDKLDQAKEKINKLAYIKNIFSEWSVEFKQQQLLSSGNTLPSPK
ncbi:MAG: hypothetical protein P4L22_05405 [Candidatus Babeliales bacterium]|nr:hypothetical protein [Candidatus Babeliales bacterium]